MQNKENTPTMTRRKAIQCAAALGGIAALGTTTRAHAAENTIKLKANDVVLFQGDSITDAGRDKKDQSSNRIPTLGNGYARMISEQLLGEYSELKLQCYNRGISGHKVPDLQKRWQKDTIDLNPAVLSILIGVNDIWHMLNGNYDGTVEDYENGFTQLLADTKKALPDTTIVICEPFVLRCGAVNDDWFPEFTNRLAAARRVAEKAKVIWVPFQDMFDKAITEETPPSYWAGDGVHPTMAGHALMAKTWMDVTGLG